MTTTNWQFTIDKTNTAWCIAHHVSGDEYAVKLASVWSGQPPDDRPIGALIIASVGPLEADDPRDNLAENYDLNAGDADAYWLNAEEDAGRITYPQAVSA